METNKAVVIITDVPTPYRMPLFNELSGLLASHNYTLHVIFDARHSPRRNWDVDSSKMNFQYEFLTSTLSRKYEGLKKVVKTINPVVVVSIGFSIATLKMWFYTLLNRNKLFIWTGSTPEKEKQLSLLNRSLRKFFFLQNSIGFIVYSSSTKEYLISKGVAENRIHVSLNTVDTAFFEEEVKQQFDGGMERSHKDLLYVGYLNNRKNVHRLLEIMKELVVKDTEIKLHIVGDGDEREKLVSYTSQNNLGQNIIFHGFKQKEELPQYYAHCGIFLFQTDFDIWGLVLNEAMAAGMCCLASVNAGATKDLISHGENGFAVDFSQKEEVLRILKTLADSPAKVEKMSKNAREFIATHATIDNSARSFAKAITGTENSL